MNPWSLNPFGIAPELSPALAVAGTLSIAYLTLQESRRTHLARLGYHDYSRYLQTSHWWWVRRRTLRAAGYRCVACGATSKQAVLHVHHNHYAFGRETPKDVTVLCAYHHALIHRNPNAPHHPQTHTRRIHTATQR